MQRDTEAIEGKASPRKPKRGHAEQVFGILDLRRGVAFEGQQGVVTNHAASVVGDLDELFAARFDLNLDAGGTGVKRVLQEFLDHRCRALHHFASRDFVGNGFGKNVDASHGMKNIYGVTVGEYVTVGHSVTLHGCVIEDRCLIGMGSIILNGAKICAGSIIAAGTLIPERTVVEPGSLWMGSPGKFRRKLENGEDEMIMRYATNYLGYKEDYLRER
jgi:hypothetical protein